MKSDDQGDHFVSGGRIGGNRWRVSGLAMAEGIQTDMGRRAGRDNPCAVRDHSHPAKLPELWPSICRLRRGLYYFGGLLGMVRGQENARSLRLDRSGDLPGGSFRHVVGSAVLIRREQFAFPNKFILHNHIVIW